MGKDAFTLCKDERDFFGSSGAFINHIEHDVNPDNRFIQEAFTGRMGLNALGRSLIDKFAREVIDRAKGDSVDALWRSLTKYPAPPGVTHQDLIQMAQDWVDAQGGKFRGGIECGCKKHHYAIGIKETGVHDLVLTTGHSHAEISGKGDVPLTFKDDGSFSGEVTLPELFTESLTRSIEVCSGKGPFSNQMKVTGKVTEREKEDGKMHLKFSWISSGTVSGTCTGKGVTIPFEKNRPGVNSADVKSPLTDGFDMDAIVGKTRDFTSESKAFTFAYTITVKQID